VIERELRRSVPGLTVTGAVDDYCFADYKLDTRLRRLYRRDELVPLTPKVFDTLLALVERAGRVVEKDELMRVVWGDTVVGDETLAQNISTLRRVLGDHADRPEFIATVPRYGYRFIAAVTHAVPSPVDAASTDVARQPPPLPRRRVIGRWAPIAALAVAIAIGWWARGPLRSVPQRAAIEFTVFEPAEWAFSTSGNMLALSPDGRQLAFVASDANGSPWLWLRPLDSAVPRLLAGTNGASYPFWSPDSSHLAFFADRRLKAIDVLTGGVRVIAMLPASVRVLGGTWSRAGDILFAVPDDGLYLVPSAGATPHRIDWNGAACAGCLAWPAFLPDGRHFLYTVVSGGSDSAGVYIGELGTTKRQRLIDVMSSCVYAAPGFLLYARFATLYAQPFDEASLRLAGSPVPIADGVAYNPRTGRVLLAASDTGVLAYRGPLLSELVWVDRAGARQGVAAPAATYLSFSIAADGRRVAAARLDPRMGTADIWMFGSGERETRVTDNPDWDVDPLWSPDGQYIVYASRRQNRWRLCRRSPTAAAPEEVLLDSETPVTPLQAVSAKNVLYAAQRPRLPFDLWQLADGHRATPLLRVGGMYPADARLSPDGHWLSYAVPERTGMAWGETLYVSRRPFLETRRAIAEGASTPRWRGDGRELFYLSQDSSLIAVPVDSQETPNASAGHMLFRTATLEPSGVVGQAYDVAPDGERFLLKRQAGSSPIEVVVNWAARLPR
jgi:DNA-binding winged helix-turn-helix (wHTH) protein/dipeptidyl aminopeptidase/acylaminoacyl peptidase